MSKSKAKTNKGKAKKVEEEDDWDDILNAEIAANAVKTDAAPPVIEPTVEAVTESMKKAGIDDEEEDEDEGGESGAKKDKKKKKKKTKKEEKKAAPPTALSANAKAILERRKKLEEEEERIKKLQEEEEARVKAEEERIAAEQKIKEDEKEKKRKAKQDKIDAQKAAGTYMTKAEKEKAKKAQARLEAMKAAGMLDNTPLGKKEAEPTVKETKKDTKTTKKDSKKEVVPVVAAKEEPQIEVVKEVENEKTPNQTDEGGTQPLMDDWDADDDDWETNLDLGKITQSLEAKKVEEEEVEDMIEVEKKREQEKLKKLGLERAKRDEEIRLKKEEEDRMQAEIEQKYREAAMRKETSRKNRVLREKNAREARTPDNLRAPISCIMGHVDTGKTSLLDKIRHTNVQEGEAGGITQQIGVTQFAKETLLTQTACMQETQPFTLDIPGLLIIDTPGHESFSNLRSRGSSLCDIAILVVDLMHQLEPQTLESIRLLQKNNTPFVVALNKIDRCYAWKSMPNVPVQTSLKAQEQNTRFEFRDKLQQTVTQLNQQGLNAKLYWENDDPDDTISLVPTSAVTGEGVPDLLRLLAVMTQERMRNNLMYMEYLQCTVLEVKVIEGLGHTVDVMLVNGTLKEGDTIVVCTMDGPVVTTIRALLTPPPSKESRIKSEYIHHSSIKGAMGVKIVAPDIGKAIAGTPVIVVQPEDDLDDVMEDVQSDLNKIRNSLEVDQRGVMVHASTLGALEALLQFLREETKPPIPVSHVNIGPIRKRDVMRANIMNDRKLPEFATILAFDVSTDTEAREMAEECNVRIFSADIIYHLFDQFSAFMKGLQDERKAAAQQVVAFPCILKILPQFVFNTKDPIVIGVEILEGTLRVGTFLCIPGLSLDVGKVTRIENNRKEVTYAKKNTQVSISIENESNPTLMYGRQFDHHSSLYSKISRASIDACKEFFSDDMTPEDWMLTVKLKKVFNIS